MKKSIEVKGSINVDKKEMAKVHGGLTCASAGSGIICKSYEAKPPKDIISIFGIIVDVLVP